MDFDSFHDFANRTAQEMRKYEVCFILSPKLLGISDFVVPNLDWNYVHFIEDDIDKVPNDRRGVYAFAINAGGNRLPPHCYILYIGVAGKDSNRALRERYKDYFNVKQVARRNHIKLMIDTWRTDLRFYYATVDDTISSEVLKTLEKQLNTALLPPFSRGDIEAEVKSMRSAYR